MDSHWSGPDFLPAHKQHFATLFLKAATVSDQHLLHSSRHLFPDPHPLLPYIYSTSGTNVVVAGSVDDVRFSHAHPAAPLSLRHLLLTCLRSCKQETRALLSRRKKKSPSQHPPRLSCALLRCPLRQVPARRKNKGEAQHRNSRRPKRRCGIYRHWRLPKCQAPPEFPGFPGFSCPRAPVLECKGSLPGLPWIPPNAERSDRPQHASAAGAGPRRKFRSVAVLTGANYTLATFGRCGFPPPTVIKGEADTPGTHGGPLPAPLPKREERWCNGRTRKPVTGRVTWGASAAVVYRPGGFFAIFSAGATAAMSVGIVPFGDNRGDGCWSG